MASPDERRRLSRYRVSTRATIRSGGGSTICSVVDVSRSGAGLLLGPDATVPDAFELVTRSGAVYAVEVAWRAYPRCGVAFSVIAPAPEHGPETRKGVVEPWTARTLRRLAPLLIALCIVLAAALLWYVLSAPPR